MQDIKLSYILQQLGKFEMGHVLACITWYGPSILMRPVPLGFSFTSLDQNFAYKTTPNLFFADFQWNMLGYES